MTQPYSERLGEALKLAADAFAGKYRKGTKIIYLSHLMQVATWVAEYGGNEDQIIAAVLHDYLEDIDGATAAELEDKFGQRVAQFVEDLSDTMIRPKPDWEVRKVTYIEALKGKSPDLKLISTCDKLHNARSILRDYQELGEELWSRFTGKRDGTLWYYKAVVEALEHEWSHPALEALRATVDEINRAAEQS